MPWVKAKKDDGPCANCGKPRNEVYLQPKSGRREPLCRDCSSKRTAERRAGKGGIELGSDAGAKKPARRRAAKKSTPKQSANGTVRVRKATTKERRALGIKTAA
jgi:hypothetical protein